MIATYGRQRVRGRCAWPLLSWTGSSAAGDSSGRNVHGRGKAPSTQAKRVFNRRAAMPHCCDGASLVSAVPCPPAWAAQSLGPTCAYSCPTSSTASAACQPCPAFLSRRLITTWYVEKGVPSTSQSGVWEGSRTRCRTWFGTVESSVFKFQT